VHKIILDSGKISVGDEKVNLVLPDDKKGVRNSEKEMDNIKKQMNMSSFV